MDIQDKPLFLIASERSGTNLLRQRITENQNYYFGPSPAHFYKHLFEAAPFYGPLTNDDNFKKLITFAFELCYNHFAPWDIQMEESEILKEYTNAFNRRNAILLGHFLMSKYAKFKGYQSYFCKDNNLYDFVFSILFEIPNAKFIYLYRDPRDFAASQLKRSLHSNNIFKIAKLWRTEQIKALSSLELLSENKVYQISYENFISNENDSINNILNFLNLEKTWKAEDDNKKDYFNVEEWKNLAKPTLKSNYNKYLKELTRRQIKIIESICWHQMKKLGYKAEFSRRPKVHKFYALIFNIYYSVTDKIRKKYLFSKSEFEWSKNRTKSISRFKNY